MAKKTFRTEHGIFTYEWFGPEKYFDFGQFTGHFRFNKDSRVLENRDISIRGDIFRDNAVLSYIRYGLISDEQESLFMYQYMMMYYFEPDFVNDPFDDYASYGCFPDYRYEWQKVGWYNS